MADSGHPPAELHERLLICRTIKLNAGALGGHRRCCHAIMQKNAQNKPQIARLILCVHITLQVYCNLFLTFCLPAGTHTGMYRSWRHLSPRRCRRRRTARPFRSCGCARPPGYSTAHRRGGWPDRPQACRSPAYWCAVCGYCSTAHSGTQTILTQKTEGCMALRFSAYLSRCRPSFRPASSRPTRRRGRSAPGSRPAQTACRPRRRPARPR